MRSKMQDKFEELCRRIQIAEQLVAQRQVWATRLQQKGHSPDGALISLQNAAKRLSSLRRSREIVGRYLALLAATSLIRDQRGCSLRSVS